MRAKFIVYPKMVPIYFRSLFGNNRADDAKQAKQFDLLLLVFYFLVASKFTTTLD